MTKTKAELVTIPIEVGNFEFPRLISEVKIADNKIQLAETLELQAGVKIAPVIHHSY